MIPEVQEGCLFEDIFHFLVVEVHVVAGVQEDVVVCAVEFVEEFVVCLSLGLSFGLS